MRVAVFPPIYLPNTELMQVMQHALVFNVLDSACSYKTIMWIVNFATATSVRKLMIRPVIGVIKIEIMTEGVIISFAKGLAGAAQYSSERENPPGSELRGKRSKNVAKFCAGVRKAAV